MQTQTRSISLRLLRVIATVWVVQLLVQIVLAAAFISGDTALFLAHSANGSMMATLPLVMLVIGVVHATMGRGRWWVPGVAVLLLLLCEAQATLGYTRVVGAHIIGGSLLLTASVLWCVALWRHRYRPRPRRTRGRSSQATTAAVLPASGPTVARGSGPERNVSSSLSGPGGSA